MDDLLQRYESNLNALAARDDELAQLLRGWTDRFDLELLPAADGGWALNVDQGQGPIRVSSAETPVADATRYVDANLPGAPGFAPVLLVGVGVGYEAAEFFRRLNREPGGRWQAMYVVEPDPEIFKAALHVADWREMVAAPHVRLFVGEDAVGRLREFLDSDPMKPLPQSVCVRGQAAAAKEAATAVGDVLRRRVDLAKCLKASVDDFYRAQPVEFWLNEDSWRVLLISSGWSHFVQYANRDIDEALTALGHTVRTIAERDREDSLTGPALLAALDEFRPHLIHHIDHMRFESSAIYPADLPFLTSMLDYFPSLENSEAAKKLGDRDFVTGYCAHWAMYGYNSARLLPQEPLVNERIFRPLESGDGSLDRLRCDISYVSNIGRTAEMYFDDERPRFAAMGDDAKSAAEELFEVVRARFAEGNTIWTQGEYADLLRATRRGPTLAESIVTAIAHAFFAQIGNALFRQIPLVALSQAGFDLHLFGRHWDHHPKLARHARGVLEHGEELNRLFAASKINLHINQMAVAHNRLYEGIAAGAFFLIHEHRDVKRTGLNLSDVLFRGRDDLLRLCEKYLCDDDARRAFAERNRPRVLERFTFTRQYERTMRDLRSRLALARIFQQWDAALERHAEPVGELLTRRDLSAWTTQIAGFDAAVAMDRLFGDRPETQDAACAFHRRLLAAAEKHDERIAAHSINKHIRRRAFQSRRVLNPSIGEDPEGRRMLVRLAEMELPFAKTPYLCAVAPDGMLVIPDGFALTHEDDERTAWRFDPDTQSATPFAQEIGLNPGSFAPDGAYWAQIVGQGICRFADGRRDIVIHTGPTTGFNVVLQTLVSSGGDIIVWDRETGRVTLFSPEGELLRDLIAPRRFNDVRGLCVSGKELVACCGGRVTAVELNDPANSREFRRAPYGRWCATAATGSRLFAALYTPIQLKNGRVGTRARAIAMFRPEGHLEFMWDGLDDLPLPLSMNIIRFEGRACLAITSFQKRTVTVFDYGAD
ncbi:MAG: glycosyltransferase family 1 protein [Deltaproteobacteria bacterium]|nr:glycosyltransferase family 1 protein [Deltaproteobacteria bacterium]